MSHVAATLCRTRMAKADAKRQLAIKHPEGSAARVAYLREAENFSRAARRAQEGDLTPVDPSTGLYASETETMNNDFDGTAQHARGQAQRQGGQPYGSSGIGLRRQRISSQDQGAESWHYVLLVIAILVVSIAVCAAIG